MYLASPPLRVQPNMYTRAPSVCAQARVQGPANGRGGLLVKPVSRHSECGVRKARALGKIASGSKHASRRFSCKRRSLRVSSEAVSRDVFQIIRDEAPFVVTREALTDDKFSYSAPMNFEVGDGAAAHLIYMLHLRNNLPKDLDKFETKVTRVFQADPNTVLVRWTQTWENELEDEPTSTVEGSTKYTLVDSLIISIEENWEVKGTPGQSRFANDVFNFTMAHRPVGESKYSRRYFPEAMKYAAWENFKEDPMFGGQLVREEMDALTMQVFYATIGLALSTVFLMGSIVFQIVS
ncbi:hypothetical protein CYMTET_23101 [Cymbomonas tetramitiformis]|uniref:Uncharacterized protein n=1 Tax=Cymbomonas tetramitiformis TaxID=36881 RepID=A0AAE0FYM2_9CHLO|nr:hypothetical protein CYMTET_23101 [Cymbomonas tetramitiformis]